MDTVDIRCVHALHVGERIVTNGWHVKTLQGHNPRIHLENRKASTDRRVRALMRSPFPRAGDGANPFRQA